MDYPQLETSEQMLLAQRATLLEQLEVNEKTLGNVRAAKHGYELAEKIAQEREQARTEAAAKAEAKESE